MAWSWFSLMSLNEVGKSIMLNLRWALSATRLTGRMVSNEALSNTADDGREEGRGTLKELERLSSPLSARACFEGRRCGRLNDAFRLSVTGSSGSDSLSSSAQRPGYWRLKSF